MLSWLALQGPGVSICRCLSSQKGFFLHSKYPRGENLGSQCFSSMEMPPCPAWRGVGTQGLGTAKGALSPLRFSFRTISLQWSFAAVVEGVGVSQCWEVIILSNLINLMEPGWVGDMSCAGAPRCRRVGTQSSRAGVSMECVLPGCGLSRGTSLVMGSSPCHGIIPWHHSHPVASSPSHGIIPIPCHHPW